MIARRAASDGADQDRRPGQVLGPFGRGDHHRAGAVGLQAEVEQAQGAGDHARGQVVVQGHRLAVHDRVRRLVGVLAASHGHRAQLLRHRAIFQHVAARHQGEGLAGGHKTVGQIELVIAPAPAHDLGPGAALARAEAGL